MVSKIIKILTWSQSKHINTGSKFLSCLGDSVTKPDRALAVCLTRTCSYQNPYCPSFLSPFTFMFPMLTKNTLTYKAQKYRGEPEKEHLCIFRREGISRQLSPPRAEQKNY